MTSTLHICITRRQAVRYPNGITLSKAMRLLDRDQTLDSQVVVLVDYAWMRVGPVSRLLDYAQKAQTAVLFQGDDKLLLLPETPSVMDLKVAWERRSQLRELICERPLVERRRM